MIKKMILLAVVGVAGIALLRNTVIGGYAREEAAAVGEWIDSKVPVEKKLKALRKEIATLDKEIDKASDELAKEIVEVDHLTRAIDTERTALAGEEKKVRAMGETIAAATERVTYGSYSVPADEAKQLLSDDVKRIVVRKQTLETMVDTLASREKIKESLFKQVDAIKRQKRELTVAVDRLDADVKRLQLQQIESKYQFDDSKLAKVKQTLNDLQKDIDVKRTKLKMAPTIAADGAPATALNVDDILAPLSGPAPTKKSN